MYYVKKGIIIFEMEFIVICEYVVFEFVRDEVVSGWVIIFLNINYFESELMIIGWNFYVKINVNIGNLVVMLLIEEEVEKMMWVICWGVDMMMDFFIGKDIYMMCEWIICNCFVFVGIVLIYQVFEKVNGVVEDLMWEIYCDMLIEQVEQGVDYFMIYVGVLLWYVLLIVKWIIGIVLCGGVIMVQWCLVYYQESFLYIYFEEICEIMKMYDIVFFFGDGFCFGLIVDVNDEV